ncbi:MAG: hypothetical protein V1712_01730 [Patescibacteria group bacterium]
MFKELSETEHDFYTRLSETVPEVTEISNKQLELDENIFQNLKEVEDLLPKSAWRSYEVKLNRINKFMLNDLEREFNILSTKPDHSREQMLEASHKAMSEIASLGRNLKRYGFKIPWIDPEFDDLIRLRDEGKLNDDKKISLFRSTEDEQAIKLIAKHDALRLALTYAESKKSMGKIGLTNEQIESIEHIINQFNNLPLEDKADFERLVNNDDFYHQSLDRLRQQLSRRLNKKGDK